MDSWQVHHGCAIPAPDSGSDVSSFDAWVFMDAKIARNRARFQDMSDIISSLDDRILSAKIGIVAWWSEVANHHMNMSAEEVISALAGHDFSVDLKQIYRE